MRSMMRCFIAILPLTSGCSVLGIGDRGTEVGVIALSGGLGASASAVDPSRAPAAAEPCCDNSPVLEAPDTVAAGVAFDAVVRTFGPNGCWRAAGHRESGSATTIEVTPYDEDISEGRMCTTAIVRLPRTVRLVFSTAGTGTLIVRGRVSSLGGSAVSTDSMTTVSKTVVVR